MELSAPDPPARALRPDSLTALHIAVIEVDAQGRCDTKRIRQLLASREHGVNERTSTGATPLMLACLFGRYNAFFILLRECANMHLYDDQGFQVSHYTLHQGLPNAKILIERYQGLAGAPARRSGRKRIRKFLDAQAPQTPPIATLPIATPPITTPPVATPLVATPPTVISSPANIDAIPGRILFTRRGGVFEILEVRRSIALVEIERDLGRKTCGGIRSRDETQYRAIAMSGWRGETAKQVVDCKLLNNAEYLLANQDTAATYGYVFVNNWLDCRAPGSYLEQAGAFSACHAEKQLAVFVLKESLYSVLGTQDVTIDNVAKLKDLVATQEARTSTCRIQTDFVIELEHKPCPCCIAFLYMITRKSGLRFEWVFREWFTLGKRPRLKVKDGRAVRATANEREGFDDEIDEASGEISLRNPHDDDEDSDRTMIEAPNSIDKALMPNKISIAQDKATHFSHSSEMLRREYPVPRKEGSPVLEMDYLHPRKSKVKPPLKFKRKRKDTRRRHMAAVAALRPGIVTDAAVADNSIKFDAVVGSTAGMKNFEEDTFLATVGPSQPSPCSSPSTGRNLNRVNFTIPIRATDLSSSPLSQSVPTPFPDVAKFMSTFHDGRNTI